MLLDSLLKVELLVPRGGARGVRWRSIVCSRGWCDRNRDAWTSPRLFERVSF